MEPEAQYQITQCAFGLGQTSGYNLACEALTQLVCIAPGHRNAIDIWWNKIFTQSEEELRQVLTRLEEITTTGDPHPEFMLYIARINWRLGETDKIPATLEKLAALDSMYKRSERLLLDAECRLDAGDTLGFEQCYNLSLDYARKDDQL